MTQQEIQERNKQIALMLDMNNDAFLLQKNIESNTGLCHLNYHRDWNLLHDVIQFIYKKDCEGDLLELKLNLIFTQISSDKNYIFKKISDFAKIYNDKKL